jgi:hypothetical protein
MNPTNEYNHLTLTLLDGGLPLVGAGLEHATGIAFETLYPGGDYGSCSFFLPGEPASGQRVQSGQTVQVYNGLALVYEGQLVTTEYDTAQGGQVFYALGFFAACAMTRRWRKWWADMRLDESVWLWNASANAAEKCNLDRSNRLRLTPKREAWALNQTAQVSKYAPTGSLIRRITFNYDLQEGAQAWSLVLWNVTAGSGTTIASSSNPTPGTTLAYDSGTLATPTTSLTLYLQAGANQTPPPDGVVYAEVREVVVYTETGAINLTEIAKDILPRLPELSADVSLIGDNTYSLVPFISEVDSYADILSKAASYGDSSFNPWAFGVRASEQASDNKPLLFVEAYPSLTTCDYELSLSEAQAAGVVFAQDPTEVRNWIAVQYTDQRGFPVWVTPDDDPDLLDQASIDKYGEMHEWITLDARWWIVAKNWGQRVLAQRKDAPWKASGEIPVTGYLRAAGGGKVPVSQVRAGQRLRIADFLGDLSGTGLTFLITATQYSDADEVCSISTGRPDQLETYLARQSGGR